MESVDHSRTPGAELDAFYSRAHAFCERHYPDELAWARSLDLMKTTPEDFLEHYARAVLSAGMREQAVNSILGKLFTNGVHPEVVKHSHKRKAIEQAIVQSARWFESAKALRPIESQMSYLGSLPGIGPVTRFHLAQNIGVNVAKPDRHLLRLAKKYGYGSNVQRMCGDLASKYGERVTTIDKVLWRYCNMGQPTE